MIHRGLWLTAGAVAGVYGYRRVAAVGRRLSGTLSLTGAAGRGGPGGPARRPPRRRLLTLTRQASSFTRDVRDGMELYKLSRAAAAGSTLSTDHDAQPEDGC